MPVSGKEHERIVRDNELLQSRVEALQKIVEHQAAHIEQPLDSVHDDSHSDDHVDNNEKENVSAELLRRCEQQKCSFHSIFFFMDGLTRCTVGERRCSA